MPKITTEDGSFEESVPYGSDWQSVAEYYPNLPIKFGCRNAECAVCAICVIKGEEHLTKMGKKETVAAGKIPFTVNQKCQLNIKSDP